MGRIGTDDEVATMTDRSADEDEPYFGDFGEFIRIRRRKIKPKIGGIYFFVWPFIWSVVLIIIAAVMNPDALGLWLFLLLLFNYYFFNKYSIRNIKPPMMIELRRDRIRCYEEQELESEIEFGNNVFVDLVMNESTRSKEYGQLYGYTFRKGESVIEFSPMEEWELWDIQNLRDPVFKVVDHHGMARGEAFLRYRKGLKAVIPIRSRSISSAEEELKASYD
jgi:hypothetical protein